MILRQPVWVRGLIHVLLIGGAVAFSLPFVWMLATSFMVEKEVFEETGINLVPGRPVPRPLSPYINANQWDGLTRPRALSEGVWLQWRPSIRERMHKRLAEIRPSYPPGVDADVVQTECIEGAWDEIRRRIPTEQLRAGALAAVGETIDRELTRELAEEKIDEAHRGFALGEIRYVRRADRRQFTLMPDDMEEGQASIWRVESGPARLVPRERRGIQFVEAHYDFTDGDAFALVAEVEAPPDTRDLANELKSLKLAYRHDETWHRMRVQAEMAGRCYETTRDTSLGMDLWAELIVQPPSAEDDDPVRIKTWTVMRPIDEGDAYHHGPRTIRVRVIVEQSSHASAWLAKAVSNYDLVGRKVPFWRFTATSVVLVTLNIVLTMLSSSLVAYAFARLHWPGRDFLFVVLLGTMMIPPQVTMIPGFVIIKSLGWYNTLTPLWAFAAFGTAFNVFLLRQFMKGIPRDLEEAARMDGCGFLRVWWHVMLPLVKPTLAAIAIFTFMGTWNDFLGPLIYVNDPRLYPLALGLFSLQAIFPPQPMPVLMAAAVMMTLPIIAIFFFAQKYFIQGVTLTGMKG